MEQALPDSSEAKKTVEAIYKYHDSTGLWPVRLSDLEPEYLDSGDAAPISWTYYWNGYEEDNGPRISSHGSLHTTLSYRFPAEKQNENWVVGWGATTEGDPITVDISQTVPEKENSDLKEIKKRSVLELNRRIKNEKDERVKKIHQDYLHKITTDEKRVK